MLSVYLLTTITKNCAGRWLGQTGGGVGVGVDCVCVLALHRRVHALRVCVCVYCICMCAVCLAASRGCGISVEVVGVVFLRPDHFAEEWKDEKEVKSMAFEGWLAGWLAGNSKLHLHNK